MGDDHKIKHQWIRTKSAKQIYTMNTLYFYGQCELIFTLIDHGQRPHEDTMEQIVI